MLGPFGFHERIEDYRWSSVWMFEACQRSDEDGVITVARKELLRSFAIRVEAMTRPAPHTKGVWRDQARKTIGGMKLGAVWK